MNKPYFVLLPLIPHEPSDAYKRNVEWSNLSDDSPWGIEGCFESDEVLVILHGNLFILMIVFFERGK